MHQQHQDMSPQQQRGMMPQGPNQMLMDSPPDQQYMGGPIRQQMGPGQMMRQGPPQGGPGGPMRPMMVRQPLPPYSVPGQAPQPNMQRGAYPGPPNSHQGSPMIQQGRLVQQQGPPPIRQPYPPQVGRPGMGPPVHNMSPIQQPQPNIQRPPPPGVQMVQMGGGAPIPRGPSPAVTQARPPPPPNPPTITTPVPQVLDPKAALIEKNRLDEIVRQIDPRLALDDNVKEALIEMSDDFVNDLIEKVCVFGRKEAPKNFNFESLPDQLKVDVLKKIEHTDSLALLGVNRNLRIYTLFHALWHKKLDVGGHWTKVLDVSQQATLAPIRVLYYPDRPTFLCENKGNPIGKIRYSRSISFLLVRKNSMILKPTRYLSEFAHLYPILYKLAIRVLRKATVLEFFKFYHPRVLAEFEIDFEDRMDRLPEEQKEFDDILQLMLRDCQIVRLTKGSEFLLDLLPVLNVKIVFLNRHLLHQYRWGLVEVLEQIIRTIHSPNRKYKAPICYVIRESQGLNFADVKKVLSANNSFKEFTDPGFEEEFKETFPETCYTNSTFSTFICESSFSQWLLVLHDANDREMHMYVRTYRFTTS